MRAISEPARYANAKLTIWNVNLDSIGTMKNQGVKMALRDCSMLSFYSYPGS